MKHIVHIMGSEVWADDFCKFLQSRNKSAKYSVEGREVYAHSKLAQQMGIAAYSTYSSGIQRKPKTN
jgi:hypothetical protein